MRRLKTLAEKFWEKVDRRQDNECWEWRGYSRRGYGVMRIMDRKCIGAHRLSYILNVGEIDPDLCVCHSCDNGLCVNPHHLRLDTRENNNRERELRGRGKYLRATNNPNGKLSDQQVEEIRRKYATHGFTQHQLAEEYKISQGHIHRIINNLVRNHYKCQEYIASTAENTIRPYNFRGTLEERFWDRVIKSTEDECWEWTNRTSRGYGIIWHNELKRHLKAHRVSYILHFGNIPDGLQVLHKCDNRACVNPNHLFLGTLQDNMDDKCSRGRQYNPPSARSPKTKLTWEIVFQIRENPDNLSVAQLAKQYGVYETTIYDIKSGTTWNENSEGNSRSDAIVPK